ncbi:DUF2631 domain-containing protein [Glycomyces xiaoerkulensis]|uniref:DUF2631 domain-containing protein n=1 Tax=Glycomyces xiaoerkulensis TaxID=2038139 RepID=UPI000C2646C9|nr:DUF2631 domain-containing protein [Glycomyces xiaoerkulensis]
MAAEEPILSPDQRKPTNRKAMYAALVIGAVINLTFLIGNHTGRIEDVFVVLASVVLVGLVAADVWLRRAGLR